MMCHDLGYAEDFARCVCTWLGLLPTILLRRLGREYDRERQIACTVSLDVCGLMLKCLGIRLQMILTGI